MNLIVQPHHGRMRRHGFAMLTAIGLIALVGVALAAAAAVFRIDLRHTATSLEEAELRQLLVAGESVARARLGSAGGAAINASDAVVTLPAALAADGASLRVRIEPGPGRTATVGVEARLATSTASQTLHYGAGATGWRLDGIELGRSSRSAR